MPLNELQVAGEGFVSISSPISRRTFCSGERQILLQLGEVEGQSEGRGSWTQLKAAAV